MPPQSQMIEVHELTILMESHQGHWTLFFFLRQICSSLLNEKVDTLTHWDQKKAQWIPYSIFFGITQEPELFTKHKKFY